MVFSSSIYTDLNTILTSNSAGVRVMRNLGLHRHASLRGKHARLARLISTLRGRDANIGRPSSAMPPSPEVFPTKPIRSVVFSKAFS